MRLLGIDPGIGRMGWGVLEVQNSKLKVQSFGCLETSPKKNHEVRLVELYTFVNSLIQEYSPEEMAIEELFFNTNTKTALVVGQARGVILLAGAQRGLPIFSYTPLQVKMAIAGYGRAEKGQVGKMVKTILGLDTIPKPDDTADALAIALTHAFSRKIRSIA